MKCLLFSFLFFALNNVTLAQDSLYDGGSRFAAGFARVKHGSTYFYIDSNGRYAFDKIYNSDGIFMLPASDNQDDSTDSSGQLPEHFLLVTKKGKLGVLTMKGKWLLQPVYDSIDTRYRAAWTVMKNNRKSLFDMDGFLLPFRFEEVYDMDGNYFNVMQNSKWGVYCKDKDSTTVPCMYEDIDYCYGCEQKGDYCFAKKNGRWGVVDFHNNVLLPFEYDHQHSNMRSDEWVECLYKNGKQLSINLKTKQTDTCDCDGKVDDEQKMAQGFYIREKNGKYGLLDARGKLVLDYQYDYIRYDADSTGSGGLPAPYVGINKDNYFGVADTTGRIIIQPVYTDWFAYIRNGSIFCSDIKGAQYIFDRSGNSLLAPQYDSLERQYAASDYPDAPELIEIKKNGLKGFYNPVSRTLVKPQFTQIDYYSVQQANSIMKIYKGNKEGFIDVNGKIIVPAIYDGTYFSYADSDRVEVKLDDKEGIYSLSRKELMVPIAYQSISELKHGLIFTHNNNDSLGYKCDGLLDASGKVIFAPKPYQGIVSLDTNDNRLLIVQSDSTGSKTVFILFNAVNHQQSILPYDSIYIGEGIDLLGVSMGKNQFALYDASAGRVVEGEYAQGGFPQKIFPYGNKALIRKNGKQDIVRSNGSMLFDLRYDYVQPLSRGIILIANSPEKTAATADVIIGNSSDSPPQIVEAVGNGLRDYVYGFADSTGRLITPVQYDINSWVNIFDYVKSDTTLQLFKKDSDSYEQFLCGLADVNGKILVPPAYSEITTAKNNAGFLVQKNKKYGIINSNGRIILPPVFDNIILDDKNYWGGTVALSFPILAEQNHSYRYYDAGGEVLPMKISNVISFAVGYNEDNLTE